MVKQHYPLQIGGAEVESGHWLPVTDPYRGSVVAEAAWAGTGEMERAVAAAQEAFPPYRELANYRRVEYLERIVEGLRRRRRELTDTIVAEAGKPVMFASGEVERAINTFTIAVEEAKRIGGEVIPLDLIPAAEGKVGMTSRFPRGPIAAITPFNFPLNLVAHKVAPALASGNTLVVKPSSQAPLSALILGEICREAGLPEGVMNVVPAAPAVAAGLAADPRIRMVTFTGSAEVGWAMRSRAGHKKVHLELGGNAAAVVEPDTDPDRAAARIALGSFAYAGQVCISVQRVLVHEELYPRFRDAFRSEVEKLPVGDPRDPATVVGPMIVDQAASRVEEWIREAVAGGAELLCGGKREGRLLSPTILAGTDPGMRVSCQEVFGPVATLDSYRAFGEALERVNASVYGLQAGVFTADLRRCFEAFRRLEVGGVIINDYPTFRVDHMPYGGVKESGLGREGVRYAIEEMTEGRLLVLDFS